jgi:hypothetical protein
VGAETSAPVKTHSLTTGGRNEKPMENSFSSLRWDFDNDLICEDERERRQPCDFGY